MDAAPAPRAHCTGRPFRVLRDGGHHARGHVRFCENFQHLALGQERICQRQFHRLRMAFRQHRAGNTRRTAPRKRQFFADGEMRHARQTITSSATRRISAGAEGSKLTANKIEQDKVDAASKARRGAACADAAQAEAVTPSLEVHFPSFAIAATTRRKIEPFEQLAHLRLVHVRILEKREQRTSVPFVNQGLQFLARGGSRALKIGRRLSSSPHVPFVARGESPFEPQLPRASHEADTSEARAQLLLVRIQSQRRKICCVRACRRLSQPAPRDLQSQVSSTLAPTWQAIPLRPKVFRTKPHRLDPPALQPAEKPAEKHRRDLSPPNRARDSNPCTLPIAKLSRQSRRRSAILFRTNHGSQRASPDIEAAAFVAEPRTASARASDASFGIASVGRRTSSHDEDHAFAITQRGLQCDLEIGRHIHRGLRKPRSRNVAIVWPLPSRPAPPMPAQIPRMSLDFKLAPLKHHVRSFAQREPGVRVARAKGFEGPAVACAIILLSASTRKQSVFVPPPSKPRK